MASAKHSGGREGLSLQTLVIAAAAAGVAAIVTSHFWRSGTVFAAAMTPVIVSIVKELLARPLESDLVRRPVQKVSEIAASRVTTGARVADPVGARTRNLPTQPPPSVPLDERGTTPEGLTPGDVVLTHPRRTYGGNGRARGRRRPRLKLAVITGLIAFVIAVAAITLPELVFGGAVASHHSTTFFGGGSSKSANDKTNDNSNGSQDQNKNNGTTTTPQDQQSGKGTSTTPQSTPGQQSGQQPNGGSQPPPTQPAPAPSSPQSGGGSGQSTPTP